MRASSISCCSGRELDCPPSLPICACGRPAATAPWLSICRAGAAAGELIMPAFERMTALRREFTAADRIPYTAHVAPTVVRTASGDYLQVFRLAGASFESNDDARLNHWHERLNILWRNV